MLRVAFATSDGRTVNQHFGQCERFDVYDLGTDAARLVETRIPATVNDATSRIDTRLALLRDCAILHVTSIGGGAAARVVHARIHPLKVIPGAAIADLNTRLVEVLASGPPPWLRKALRAHDAAGSTRWSPP